MALPRVNETLNFTMEIPSTGRRVKYRPYLVKEEKILLQAFESQDPQTCLEAMTDTIVSCLDPSENIDMNKLATFDIEYMFTQLRSKSVGETSTIIMTCKKEDCKMRNEYVINLEELHIDVPTGNNIISITDNISVEMQYPSYGSLMEGDVQNAEKDVNAALEVIARSIAAVITEEERIDCESQEMSEIIEFIQSMTATQLEKITEFLQNVPALTHLAQFNCIKCGTENELELKGLTDFF